jgi:hypothetical protein
MRSRWSSSRYSRSARSRLPVKICIVVSKRVAVPLGNDDLDDNHERAMGTGRNYGPITDHARPHSAHFNGQRSSDKWFRRDNHGHPIGGQGVASSNLASPTR